MPRIREEFLNTLRDRLDIEEFISGYVPLKRAGRLSKGLCPFHSEKTPSFTVYPDNQSFYCFGCGKGGDIITFTRDIENLDYLDAVRFLSDRAGLQMPDEEYDDTLSKKRKRMYEINKEAARFFHQELLSEKGRGCLDYWTRQRGLTPKTIKHFGLGYAPDDWHALHYHMRGLHYSDQELLEANLLRRSEKNGKVFYYDNFRNRAMVPIIDLRGNVIAFGGRVLDDSKPKYVNTSDTLVYKKSSALFALNFAKGSGTDQLILCEGYLDVITLHQAGFTNAVAGLGTALTDEQVRLIARYCREVVLSYDSDDAGREATHRALQKFEQTDLTVRSLTMEGGKDPDEIIKKFGADRFRSMLDGASNETEYRLKEQQVKFDLTTDDGKVRYIEAASFILAALAPAERYVYTSRVAEETGVSREAVESQVARAVRRKRNRREQADFTELTRSLVQQDPSHGAVSQKVLHAEETILASLLKNPDYLKKIGERLEAEDFSTEFGRKAYSIIAGRLREGKGAESFILSQYFDPEEMGQLARIQNAGVPFSGTLSELEDCIAVLKHREDRKASGGEDISDEELRGLFSKG
ncbi:MAG: DNA primase [Clostridia bacterium]|nr:DNA primase [Clostridia bacterium]MBR1703988.1 DNA primase [Clostridia bacterium]